jgi:TolB-like protein/Tfp pilus assembly protein PilF
MADARDHFGDVTIDRDGFRVLKDGQVRPLTPRAFDVLLFLIEQRGRLVEKRELFDRFWSDAFVTDNALTRVIKEIRQAIGDDATTPRYIETAPKRGYRFIAELAPQPTGKAAGATTNSIAVLPFVNGSQSADAEYLSDGITAGIINTLSQLSGVRVLARGTVFSYKGREGVAPQAVGKALNVGAVVTGRVAPLGDSLVISAELADATDGTHLWGRQYTRRLADVLDVQDEIAREISDNLRLQLSSKEQEQLARRYTEDAEAYRLYLKGYYSLYKFTPDGLMKSFVYFNRAIERDPNYALAYAGLVEAYFNLSFLSSPTDVWTKAKEAALRALQIDGNLAEAHYAVALVSLCYDRDWRTAEKEFERAIALRPGYGLAHDWYAIGVLAQAGRFDEAFAEIGKATELDPLSLATNCDYGTILYWAGRYEQAREQLKKVIELENNFYIAHVFLGLVLLQTGELAEAINEMRMAREQSNNPLTTGFLGYAYARAGETSKAREALAELLDQSESGYVPPDAIAVIHLGLGEQAEAFEWLRKACDRRTFVSLSLAVDPIFAPLRDAPQFADLLNRIGLGS